MKIDLIIPSHRNEMGLRRFLQSLTKVDRSALQTVVVVFNPPEPELALSLEKEFSPELQFKFLQREITGVNCARNAGARVSTAALLFFADDDEEVKDLDLFNRHLAKHLAQPEMMVLGGSYTLGEGTGFWSQVYHSIQKDWFETGFLVNGCHYQLLGGHLSIKRELFSSFQFEDKIKFGGAETELLKRLQKAGVPCCGHLDLSIHHNSEMSLRKLLRKAYLQGKGHSAFQFSDVRAIPRRILPGQLAKTQYSIQMKIGRFFYRVMFDLGRNPQLWTLRKLEQSTLITSGQRAFYALFLFFEFLSDRRFEPKSRDQLDSQNGPTRTDQIY